MSKVGQIVTSTKTFVGEVQAELKKCNWPTRQELMESTIVVIVAVILLAVAVGFSDVILLTLMQLVLR